MAEGGTGAYLTLAVESLEAEVESLREQLEASQIIAQANENTMKVWDAEAARQRTRAETAEAKLAAQVSLTNTIGDERDEAEAKLAEAELTVEDVEKERDEAVQAHKASAELWWKQRASMDRAREALVTSSCAFCREAADILRGSDDAEYKEPEEDLYRELPEEGGNDDA